MAVSAAEAALLKAVRKLHAAEAESDHVPDELRVHGSVSVKRAAALLGVKASELTGEASNVPVLPDGTVPLSEVRRERQRRQRRMLAQLASVAKRLVDGGRFNPFGTLMFEDDFGFRSDDGVARELGVSKAEARRLMAGPLFTRAGRRGRHLVTVEELGAYKRKLERERQTAPH